MAAVLAYRSASVVLLLSISVPVGHVTVYAVVSLAPGSRVVYWMSGLLTPSTENGSSPLPKLVNDIVDTNVVLMVVVRLSTFVAVVERSLATRISI